MKKTIGTNLVVGLESEVKAFWAGNCDLDEKLRAKAAAACMLLSAIVDLYGSKEGSGAKTCPYSGLPCAGHEFLPNGSRVYLDHGYVEYATPTCASTSDAVAAIRAGDLIIQNAAAKLKEALEGNSNAVVTAVRNNIDHKGHSFGAHVNIRMTREGYERIFDAATLNGFVLPFFISLPLICGSGRCGSEDGEDLFQIWQRSDFLKQIIGLQTTFDRPLVNSRDESLSSDSRKYARFHIVAFDANRLEVAEFLKLGLLRLLCCAIDLDEPGVNLELMDPIAAVRSISRQPFKPIRLTSNKTITPLEIQRVFFTAFSRLYDHNAFAGRVPDAAEILTRWDHVLTALEKDPFSLIGSLDWITKSAWLEQIRGSKNLEWKSPQMKWLDLKYHCLTGDDAPNVPCERVTTDRRIAEFITNAPQDSRAALRGEMVRRFGSEILVNWHYFFSLDEEVAYLLPDDPETGMVEAIRRADTLKEAVDSLDLTRIQLNQHALAEAESSETPESKKRNLNS